MNFQNLSLMTGKPDVLERLSARLNAKPTPGKVDLKHEDNTAKSEAEKYIYYYTDNGIGFFDLGGANPTAYVLYPGETKMHVLSLRYLKDDSESFYFEYDYVLGGLAGYLRFQKKPANNSCYIAWTRDGHNWQELTHHATKSDRVAQ